MEAMALPYGDGERFMVSYLLCQCARIAGSTHHALNAGH